MDSESSKTQQRKPLATLFLLFLKISLTSFGGSSAAWVYREVVERRGWLDEKAYLTGLTIAQVLPGANPLNLSLYIVMQLRGGSGAVVAVLGLFLPAFFVIIGRFVLYHPRMSCLRQTAPRHDRTQDPSAPSARRLPHPEGRPNIVPQHELGAILFRWPCKCSILPSDFRGRGRNNGRSPVFWKIDFRNYAHDTSFWTLREEVGLF